MGGKKNLRGGDDGDDNNDSGNDNDDGGRGGLRMRDFSCLSGRPEPGHVVLPVLGGGSPQGENSWHQEQQEAPHQGVTWPGHPAPPSLNLKQYS